MSVGGNDSIKLLRRYTDWKYALEALMANKIALFDYSKWDDMDDKFFMDTYKEHKNYNDLYALCMTYGRETYAHWQRYAQNKGGECGVCIEIDFNKFMNVNNSILKNVTHKEINYKKSKNSFYDPINCDDLPFAKKNVYENEKEYRFISDRKENLSLNGCVIKVLWNPWDSRNESDISELSELRKLGFIARKSNVISNEKFRKAVVNCKSKNKNGAG